MTTNARENGWNGWRVARWSAAAALLMVPAVMMQVSDEWNWGPASFVVAGALLAGVLLAYEWAARRNGGAAYRAGVVVALVASFLVVWINLAVGIVGSEENPVNLSFFCLVFAAGIGAFAAEFRPAGMARAMLGVAMVQMLLAMIIATATPVMREPGASAGVLVLSAFIAALWLGAAALFRAAARQPGA